MPIPLSVSPAAPLSGTSAALFTGSLQAAGSEMFCASLLAALSPVSELAHCTLVQVAGRHASMAAAASRDARPDALRLTRAYVGGYFLQDPLVREHSALPHAQRSRVTVRSTTLSSLANSDYLELFFTQPAIADKLSVIVPSPDAVLFLNFYKSTEMGQFQPREKAAIAALGDFLGTLTQLHSRLAAIPTIPTIPAMAEIEPELLRRWQTLLSAREKAVACALGRGATAKAAAAALALAPSSVITYKKRAFAKLGITRQGELAALVALLGAAAPG
ncbi:LuxR C-terminal-related transcriptional regulator [Paraburkholderia bonniea]|uniref:LuxR C-terminal-related transcriptional regulator n=1 Tax=Paraburkholderia bonniea TaxID=2152891 RepID=UPI001FE9A2CF|nr:LuxR C-terminal-related transcriptional regulator [Paraburkholderia bonniea]WJF92103.1 LuxR C-terminal-related transcriptional regulator [Paraburkholderia bonniea]WJF95423.1 LuxR C-terminal-related transcriptional regulator [Paraburkholderia bonniea]